MDRNLRLTFLAVLALMLMGFNRFAHGAGDESDSKSDSKSVALVYKGAGSCEDGCSEAAAEVAKLAGFQVRYVGPQDLPEGASAARIKALFSNAKVWVQPGGYATTQLFAMTYELRQALKAFVAEGGGYVGFCAGAFMATDRIGTTRYAGLGIAPGRTAVYYPGTIRPDLDYSLQNLEMKVGKKVFKRTVYFEGGPYFHSFGGEGQAEATSIYETGYTAAIRAKFGKGRVYLSGPHPEAPKFWTEEDGIVDPDGVDHALAASMVRWAAGE